MKYKVNEKFLNKHCIAICKVNDIIIPSDLIDLWLFNDLRELCQRLLRKNQKDFYMDMRLGVYDRPGESDHERDARLLYDFIQKHPEFTDLATFEK
ncbi:hypothetical protein [Methanobrevibacter sp. UBA337]|jgi:hypothetical protein|uniref:hypothetical protein n=1 Tax=Methanobrevibacter sp. UBA337 TaxID=1915480 RepID=UPI0039B87A46